MKEFGLSHTDQPCGPLIVFGSILAANIADCAGFADYADS